MMNTTLASRFIGVNGAAKDSLLGPALANIFIGYYKEKLFSEISKLVVFFRYVDDAFVIFQDEKESEKFLIRLNGPHSSLQFTFEKEKNNSLPILDVHVEHTKSSYEAKVYRKPPFTGQYLRRKSFTPIKRKARVVSTFVHRALKICSKSKLKEEINRIKEISLDNEYPEDFVLKQYPRRSRNFHAPSGLALTSVQSTFGSSTGSTDTNTRNCYGCRKQEGSTDTRKVPRHGCRKLLWIRGFTDCICLQTNASCKSEECSTCHSKKFRHL